jgi:hypothetical protein
MVPEAATFHTINLLPHYIPLSMNICFTIDIVLSKFSYDKAYYTLFYAKALLY